MAESSSAVAPTGNDLAAISQTIGIDLEALREKYTRPIGPTQQQAKSTTPSADEILDKYKVCDRCQGSGIMTINYNHQLRQSNCSECGGEGMMTRQQELIAEIVEANERLLLPKEESVPTTVFGAVKTDAAQGKEA